MPKFGQKWCHPPCASSDAATHPLSPSYTTAYSPVLNCGATTVTGANLGSPMQSCPAWEGSLDSVCIRTTSPGSDLLHIPSSPMQKHPLPTSNMPSYHFSHPPCPPDSTFPLLASTWIGCGTAKLVQALTVPQLTCVQLQMCLPACFQRPELVGRGRMATICSLYDCAANHYNLIQRIKEVAQLDHTLLS